MTEMAYRTNTTIYIGFFDLEKAFDKVSRYKLLKKLVAMGIGRCMFEAIKKLYLCTYCVLGFGKEFSTEFQTFSGIRQGASSSALFFIAFIDGLFDYLTDRCPNEVLLENMLHCLLHADDTAILRTNRDLFIDKCNHMLDYFELNDLSLNLEKSGYLIINGSDDERVNLELKNGVLEYHSIMKYLGVKISDNGNLKRDIELHIEDKRANVTIKFGNFCRKNFLAPLEVKLHVLNVCVSASLLYSCETWCGSNFKSIEVLYRQGLKTALGVRKCVNNEIVYTECDEYPLKIRIMKQQLKFWLSLNEYLQDNPQHYLNTLIDKAKDYPYITYYKNLQQTYTDTKMCDKTLKEELKAKRKDTIENAARLDENSKLGSYLQVNPTLEKPIYDNKLEFQRVCVTRYRTGSHNLAVEKGRFGGTLRDDRLCSCYTGIQTVKHVVTECPLLADAREQFGVVDLVNGVMNDAYLLEMEKVLAVK